MYTKRLYVIMLLLLSISIMLLLLVSCGNSDTNTPVVPTVTMMPTAPNGENPAESAVDNPDTQAGYPDPSTSASIDNAYPIQPPDNLLSEPPDPERDIPEPAADLGAVGGVLAREITDRGFIPVSPKALYLGEVIKSDQGREAFISVEDTSSPQAELFPTGVFVFNNVPPGKYGLVIDLGFAQFPVTNPEGGQMFIEVEAGKAVDLGQIMVTLPEQ